jgi:hypothetical protein
VQDICTIPIVKFRSANVQPRSKRMQLEDSIQCKSAIHAASLLMASEFAQIGDRGRLSTLTRTAISL